MASTDARPIPIKNTAYRVTFPILNASGDLVTAATALDSEVSNDGGAFADCTNEATEIGASGIYYLDLTSTEMNADCVAIVVKTSSSGAKTVPIVLYPQEAGDIKVDLQSVAGTAQSAGDLFALLATIAGYIDTEVAAIKAKTDSLTFTVAGTLDVNVTNWKGTTAPAMTGDAYARLGAPAGASVSADVAAVKGVLPAALVSGRMDCSVGAMAANVLTATAIAADAITDAKVAADVTIASVTGNIGGNVVGSVGSLATQAKTDVENAVWNTVLSGHLTAGSTGNALNAAGSAGDPWSTTLPGAYGAGTAGNIIGNRIDAAISSRLASAGYTAPLDASGTRSAVGLASANLDGQLGAIAGYIDTEIGTLQSTATAIKSKTDNLPAAPAAVGDIPTANTNADALLDRAAGVETGWTIRQAMRIMLSVLAGKASGLATTTAVYRDMADSKNRISATVDADGNRTAVTRDAT